MLATLVQRGAEPMANAHWIVGAFSLATGDYAAAISSFEKSRDTATEGHLRGAAILSAGYIGIAIVAGKKDAARGETELAEAKRVLIAEKIQDGQFFADQLTTAYRVFVK